MKDRARHLGPAILALALVACGGGGGSASAPTRPTPTPAPTNPSPAGCTLNGTTFACSGIELVAWLTPTALGGARGNDSWGWTDPLDGTEYALMGLDNGVAFVALTTPPRVAGHLATRTTTSTWRDIKVHANHAYIVADAVGAHGMQVFDLTRLRGATGASFPPDHVYEEFGSAHNIAINEDTAFAYAVGSDTCDEALHMIDLAQPTNPLFAGCHSEGHTHDAQCVVYAGPDPDHAGSEICINSDEDHFAIVDVTFKPGSVTLADMEYPNLGFVHQAWLTEDHRFAFVGDEFDELSFGFNTRTVVIDVTDLDAPVYHGEYRAATTSVDHNLYVRGNRLFQANYTSGLRVLEFDPNNVLQLTEVAWIDTHPDSDAAEFSGAWNVYPYFDSGLIVISDVDRGLFVVRVTI